MTLLDGKPDWFTRVVFSVAASLITAGVVGLVAMSGQIERIDERIKSLDERIIHWAKNNTDRIDTATKQIDQIAAEQRNSDRRLGVIEGRLRNN